MKLNQEGKDSSIDQIKIKLKINKIQLIKFKYKQFNSHKWEPIDHEFKVNLGISISDH
jgi:hypothetical protein